ncbi:hypothetical protein [Sulfolobus monocaudavirus SMV3]|uniref:hypothetical protein n=1 Tax=Sulfolobus monocaudavirus SMV3 TaxID=1732177 RepID=UPI000705F47E|nr:hypothetical protein AXI69_gp27 [Sulfolobus monocaudavirus SMV3]ALG96964.1 hypothetical protein [Sulfolobus monocaudavirus SMV3]
MEPRKVAELVMKRVVNYCLKTDDYSSEIDEGELDTFLVCLEDHRPCQLKYFVYEYLPEKKAKDLKEAIENSKSFLDEVQKEYDKLWEKEIISHLGEIFGDELSWSYLFDVWSDETLDDEEKAEYLEDFVNALKEFRDEIERALKDKKPLDEYDFSSWFNYISHTLGDDSNDGYIDYYADFYDILSDNGKLELLKILLDTIKGELPDLYDDLKILKSRSGALTNER